MKEKRGSTGEWFLFFLMAIVVGGLVLFISSNIFYVKSEVYTKEEVDNSLDKVSCEYIHFADDISYYERTSRAICGELEKEPEALFIREIVSVFSELEGNVIYRDENYLVDTTLFDVPLGEVGEESIERNYGNPSFGNNGNVNKVASGLLCCG